MTARSAPNNLLKFLAQLNSKQFMVLVALIAVMSAVGIGVVFSINPVYAIAGIMGLAAVYGIVQEPKLGVLLLTFMTWTNLSDILIRFHGAPSIARLLVPFLMGIIFLRWILYREAPTGWRTIAVLLLINLFVAGLSLVYAESFSISKYKFMETLKDSLIALVAVILLKDIRTFRQVMWIFVLVGIFLGTISVVQYITGDFSNNYWGFGQANVQQIVLGQSDDYRIAGNIGDPNPYGQIIIVIIPICLHQMRISKSLLVKSLAGWGFGVTLLTVILTFSRGAFLSLVAMFLVMAILNPPKPSTIIMGIFIFFLISPVMPAEYMERMTSLFDIFSGPKTSGVEDGSFNDRASHIYVGIEMFIDHPILGAGFGHFGYHYQEYSRVIGINRSREGRSAHNRWLEVTAEQGLVGLATYLTLLGAMYKSLTNGREKLRSLGMRDEAEMVIMFGAGVIGYLATSTFLSDDYPRFFWLIFGISMAAINVANNAVAATASELREEPAHNTLPTTASQ